MSTHVVDKSTDFVEMDDNIKNLINSGFHLMHKCNYEAFSLKLEFNKIFIGIRQLIEDYKDQEFPDIYEHLKMIRTVNQTFQDWMMLNVGNITGIVGFNKVGSPRANSTQKYESKFKQNTKNSFFTPLSRAHEGTYRAVRHFHDTLNQLQLNCTSYDSSKQASVCKKPKFNVSRTRLRLPRRRMNFSKSFNQETPQTQ